jgi:pimeloyl-ACP methyl ester carboxylesterase
MCFEAIHVEPGNEMSDETERDITWRWSGKTIQVGLERQGVGPILLLLPALSSISTRGEMRPLQQRLAGAFTTVSVDWPGFGDRAKPRIDWRPQTYAAFLEHLLTEVVPQPFATVAAGHGASYALKQAAMMPGSTGRLCLVAPTWRGPLPTMIGKHHPAFAWIARAVDQPFLGQFLYSLNVNRLVVRMMGRGHVYADPGWLNGSRLGEKLAVTRAAGARHASARFVAGELDTVRSRAEFAALAEQIANPILVIYGAGTPLKSKAEMEALAARPNVRVVILPLGKLSVHEEFPSPVADAITSFLVRARLSNDDAG